MNWRKSTLGGLLSLVVLSGACGADCPPGLIRNGDVCQHRVDEEPTDEGTAGDSDGDSPMQPAVDAGQMDKSDAGKDSGTGSKTDGVNMSKAGTGAAGESETNSGSAGDPKGYEGSAGTGGADAGSTEMSMAGSSPDMGDMAAGGQAGMSEPMSTGPVCGDKVKEGDEACDGDCPTSCMGKSACLPEMLMGSADDCSAMCVVVPITEKVNGDGCCPDGANAGNDSDCSAKCGDGVVSDKETCDGNCPTSCPGGSKCMGQMLIGKASNCTAECVPMEITAKIDGDGCCPNGATLANDKDCQNKCGDGVVAGNELCDGNCPTSCSGGSKCMREELEGTPGECNAHCVPKIITAKEDGDGCCPDGATLANDKDCSAKCGDGVVSGEETCDGNCPTSCSGSSMCTKNTLKGFASDCSAECVTTKITEKKDGDGCCPDGANASNDKDCPSKCGDGQITGDEECDPSASGWTSATCNSSSCTRTVYHGCEVSDSECPPGQQCDRRLCTPQCASSGECPSIPTAEEPFCSQQHNCWLPCTTTSDCPSGLVCHFFDTVSWRGILIPAVNLCVQDL